MRASNGPLFTAADVVSSPTSSPISLYNIFGFSVQLIFTGAPVGSVSIEVSNDPSLQAGAVTPLPTNFTVLASSTTAISAAGSLMLNIVDPNYNWFRVVYTATSGTGALSGRYNLKGI